MSARSSSAVQPTGTRTFESPLARGVGEDAASSRPPPTLPLPRQRYAPDQGGVKCAALSGGDGNPSRRDLHKTRIPSFQLVLAGIESPYPGVVRLRDDLVAQDGGRGPPACLTAAASSRFSSARWPALAQLALAQLGVVDHWHSATGSRAGAIPAPPGAPVLVHALHLAALPWVVSLTPTRRDKHSRPYS
jgi:hypothetical protein